MVISTEVEDPKGASSRVRPGGCFFYLETAGGPCIIEIMRLRAFQIVTAAGIIASIAAAPGPGTPRAPALRGCTASAAESTGDAPVAAAVDDSRGLSCFMILAGREATASGSVLLAHNNDLTGSEAAVLEKFPRALHPAGETVDFPSGLSMPQADTTFAWLVMRIEEGFAEGDAVAVNEHQVAVAGGVALGSDRNERAVKADPLVSGGLTGGVRYAALQRSRTARELIETVGAWYTRYGVTYPSGFAAADTSEIWYIESGGGRTWAAVRVPDDHCRVQANGYGIGEVPEDDPDLLHSPGLHRFCRENGLWDPAACPLVFREAFGGRYISTPGKRYYNARRVWRGLSLLDPSLRLDPGLLDHTPSVRPAGPVTLEQLFSILRDHYQGTVFDVYGPDGGSGERPIASPRCVHTDVIVLRAGMPADIGAVIYAGPGMPPAVPYLPFYFGIDRVPGAYSAAGGGAAFHIFRRIAERYGGDYYGTASEVMPVWRRLEAGVLSSRDRFESSVLYLYEEDREAARDLLTAHVDSLCAEALSAASRLTAR